MGEARFTYALFGERVLSGYPFQNRLLPAEGGKTLEFSRISPDVEAALRPGNGPVYENGILNSHGQSSFSYHAEAEHHVASFPDVVQFYLMDDKILYSPGLAKYDVMIEIHFLGSIMSLWLERSGVIALHASAVVIDDSVVGFLASNTGGKSSIAASFLQANASLSTDDILPLRVTENGIEGSAGYPQMRMWPDMARHFMGHTQFPVVNPAYSKVRIPVGPDGLGSFSGENRRLKCLYLPEMTDPDNGRGIRIEAIPRTEAVFRLAQNSFSAAVLGTLPSAAERLDRLAAIVSQIPVRRVSYPKLMDILPRVREAILTDLDQESD